jgi:hypothetical protein
VNFPGRSRNSHRWGGGFIATVSAYCEHKSWAVKLLAYTLDRSIICASALQQKLLFPQVMGITLFSVFGMVGLCAIAPDTLSSTPIHPFSSPDAQT